ncbi:MAG: hypothetical protein KIC59_01705 [Lactobacillus jensenii]|uniref:Uncharacterized protein n=2 Tax=Lactobacillus jensenii TaxID=109790 RepID=A0A5N1IDL4_LACJE|nr:hypothetical protein [Lactobacillus jensenii]EEX26657.1 hypothetical protein HMPREF0527_01496 [Lactobacillus jensenii SJ-7A-US]KAA9322944.1 hypothetical protein F6H94_04095 [Lactobacillus jensenii]MBS5831759.1 hypothetical protein [Lactobacillus jensenii]MDT9586412.1 hypothetical protein [Lactobacillus jensenii]TVV11657.1 hypothetical protein FOF67_01790 [Lactobacillus jensenii]
MRGALMDLNITSDDVLNAAMAEITRLENISLRQQVVLAKCEEKIKDLQHELDMRDKLKGGDNNESTKSNTGHKQKVN